ncbi:MAG TPA: phosphatase PAP2 family protein [Vicinamibacterales bacterium]|nr:phosphatase PAP2 family protein [Vicinamibacterales bacterium]
MLTHLLTVDHLVRAWVVGHRIRALDAVMVTLSAVGRGGMVWLATGAALTALRKMRWPRYVQLAAALALASLMIDGVLKPAVHRRRPFTSFPAVAVIADRPHDASFPSGHAGNAFAAAAILARAAPAWQPAWWALAALIAYSRVYVGVHYPLDVVAGAITGAASAIVVLLASAALTRSRVKGT